MKKLLVLCAGIALFSACKKDEKDDNKSRKDHLTAGSWKMQNLTMRTQGPGFDSTEDMTGLFEACNLDDMFAYGADFKYTVSEGATKCDPSDPDVSDKGVWVLIENDSKLVTVSEDGYADTSNISELNGSTLKMYLTEKEGDVTNTMTATFKH